MAAPRSRRSGWLPAWCLLIAATPPAATTVYQCTDAAGAVSYQDVPCPPSARSKRLSLPDAGPSSALPAPATDTPLARPAPSPAPAAAEPPPPLPALFRCVRATDGGTYLSQNGQPAPYQAPLGMLGRFGAPLSQVYGPDHGAAGMSAPEANRGRVTAALVANYYVWVQDRCEALSPAETCAALADAYAEVERKLQRAFDSQKPPLEARERTLLEQLRACR